jgi:hypothetical protein
MSANRNPKSKWTTSQLCLCSSLARTKLFIGKTELNTDARARYLLALFYRFSHLRELFGAAIGRVALDAVAFECRG